MSAPEFALKKPESGRARPPAPPTGCRRRCASRRSRRPTTPGRCHALVEVVTAITLRGVSACLIRDHDLLRVVPAPFSMPVTSRPAWCQRWLPPRPPGLRTTATTSSRWCQHLFDVVPPLFRSGATTSSIRCRKPERRIVLNSRHLQLEIPDREFPVAVDRQTGDTPSRSRSPWFQFPVAVVCRSADVPRDPGRCGSHSRSPWFVTDVARREFPVAADRETGRRGSRSRSHRYRAALTRFEEVVAVDRMRSNRARDRSSRVRDDARRPAKPRGDLRP